MSSFEGCTTSYKLTNLSERQRENTKERCKGAIRRRGGGGGREGGRGDFLLWSSPIRRSTLTISHTFCPLGGSGGLCQLKLNPVLLLMMVHTDTDTDTHTDRQTHTFFFLRLGSVSQRHTRTHTKRALAVPQMCVCVH